jgi:hypothetical protein
MEVRPEPIRTSRRMPTQLVVAVVLLAVAAVAVGAALLQPGALAGAPTLGAVSAAAGSSAPPSASPDPSAKPGSGNAWGRGAFPGMSGAKPGWMGNPGGRGSGAFLTDIRITAIDGTKVSLQSANGWSRTLDAAGVTITRAGATIAATELKVGDRIAVSETRGSDGTFAVTKLTVVLDEVAGTITSIATGAITVTQAGSKTATIKTDASTVYRRAGEAIARSDLAVGERLTASGAKGSDGSLTAQAVDVVPDMAFGTVTKKSGSTLTVSTFGGGTVTIEVTSKTTVQVQGKANATLADIAVKDVIVAQGVLGSDGVLTATSVRVGMGRPMSMNGHDGAHSKTASPSPSTAGGTSG